MVGEPHGPKRRRPGSRFTAITLIGKDGRRGALKASGKRDWTGRALKV
jgi:hypothetical protein